MKNKFIIALFTFPVILLFGYWLKNQMSINLFESRSLSDNVPFKYFQRNDVVVSPKPGVLLDDSFNVKRIFPDWSTLWMREQGKVAKGYDLNGMNNSRCLIIKNSSKKSWSYSHNKCIEVKKGDVFSFDVYVKLDGEKISTYAGVSAFDKNKEAIKWNYISEKANKTNTWIKIEKRFTISDDINYIRFKLSGIGIGEYRFDDIVFRKEYGNSEI